MKKLYTDVELRAFDVLTKRLSSPVGHERIMARISCAKFEREHGEEKCKAMFEVLKNRDARNQRRST
jgi:hypothetical protein